MTKMLCATMQFRGDDSIDDDGQVVEITEVMNGGIVEIAMDIKRGTDRLYIQIPLHELTRLAMTFRDKEGA